MQGAWWRLAATCAAVLALLVAAVVVDLWLAGVRPINERPPSFAPADRLRTGIVLAAAIVFFTGVLRAGAAPRSRA